MLILINWIFISKEKKKKEREQQRVAKLKEKKYGQEAFTSLARVRAFLLLLAVVLVGPWTACPGQSWTGLAFLLLWTFWLFVTVRPWSGPFS